MGNVAVVEDLVGVNELDKLNVLDASETKPEKGTEDPAVVPHEDPAVVPHEDPAVVPHEGPDVVPHE